MLEPNFVRVNRLFVLVYFNKNNDVKQFKTQSKHNQKFIASSSMEKHL